MILLVGSEGSMGKRYQAILRHLNIDFIPYDLNTKSPFLVELLKCERVIVATPTDTHKNILETAIKMKKDILCEKPICKSSKEVEELCNLASKNDSKLNMVFQYGEIAKKSFESKSSYYNYFRTGNDGLYWDCLQIISLASGPIKLENNSPIWKCEINDEELSIQSMDYAYVRFIQKWHQGHINQNHEWIINCHKKVEEYARNQKN